MSVATRVVKVVQIPAEVEELKTVKHWNLNFFQHFRLHCYLYCDCHLNFYFLY